MDLGALLGILGALAGVIGALATVWFAIISARTAARQEARERQRLNQEVLGQSTINVYTADHPKGRKVQKSQDQASTPGQPSPEEHVPPRDAVYDQLLINDYALGLTQARRAFNVSMAFSILGGLVLVLGIALAIFRADTGGQVAGAAITSAAGVLTSGLSQLFRGQSTKALKHLEAQAVELRKDVRAQANASTAQSLLDEVADEGLRSRLQAALILQFTGAKLPDLDRSSLFQLGESNGSSRSSEVKEPSSSSTDL